MLDGQQRITSLLGSIKGARRTAKKTFSIFFNLKKAFEEKDKPNELQSNLFLDEDEFNDFSEEDKIFIIPVKLNRNEINSKTLDIREHKDQVWTHIRFNEQTDINELIGAIRLAYNNAKN